MADRGPSVGKLALPSDSGHTDQAVEEQGERLARPERFLITSVAGLTLNGRRVADASADPSREREVDSQGRSYATGRRGHAVARVWMKQGSGKIIVNGHDQEVYFSRPTLRLVINQPFEVAGRIGRYDVVATVKGGGLSNQAGAVKHGIAQALAKFEPALHGSVKAAGFLNRDTRVVERKKYGREKMRRSFQFTKK